MERVSPFLSSANESDRRNELGRCNLIDEWYGS
jgi:hypothetical protein